ncbi:HAD family hydrolase [Patescibacteria group bacterium]
MEESSGNNIEKEMAIEFIYFDVGGVVILDFSKTDKWERMLDELGVRKEDRDKLGQLFSIEESKFCLGDKETDSFISILKNTFKLKLPGDYSLLNDFVNRFEPNPSLGEIILELKRKYKVGLLTNMYPGMLGAIESKGLLPNIEWDVIVDSSEVGFQKPQPEIFKLASGLAKTSPDKILFVENSNAHIETARGLGWKTVLYNPSNIDSSNAHVLETLRNI